MTVGIVEQRLGALRWLVASGPDAPGVFRAVGEHARHEIRDAIAALPVVPRLARHVGGAGAGTFAAVAAAGAAAHPEIWAELEALAEGSGVSLSTLARLNHRGDLGPLSDMGCSDLCWRRERSFIAHNEDGPVELRGRCMMLTLAIGELPTVTAFWYPGFLPSNAVTVTSDGLVWTLDSLPVAVPRAAAGRHLVARGLQRSARTLDDAVSYLAEHASAGGFAYHIGDRRTGRVVSVEAAAGEYAVVETTPANPLSWHTNHGLHITGVEAPLASSSHQRAAVLAALTEPVAEPTGEWFRGLLAGAPPPKGVRVDGSLPGATVTLATFVADLTAGRILIELPGSSAVPTVIALDDLATGARTPHT